MIRKLYRRRIFVLLFVAVASVAGAQVQTGSVVGVVRDSAGVPIGRVTIGVVGSTEAAHQTTSNDSGAFRLNDVAPGAVDLFARRIGYASEASNVTIVAGAATKVNFVLPTVAVQLQGTVVESDGTRGKMGPFNRRKARGVGSFVTRSEIEKRQAASISELLRYLPGIGVTQKMAGEAQPVHMQRSINTTLQGTCVVQIYVDGHPYPNGNVDDFDPLAVEGIEVYRSASEIPADFRTRDATCGIISLWTRDPESARRRP